MALSGAAVAGFPGDVFVTSINSFPTNHLLRNGCGAAAVGSGLTFPDEAGLDFLEESFSKNLLLLTLVGGLSLKAVADGVGEFCTGTESTWEYDDYLVNK